MYARASSVQPSCNLWYRKVAAVLRRVPRQNSGRVLELHSFKNVTGVKRYPSFGEAQLSIGIGAAEKSGDQHARLEMEGLLNELS